MTLILILLLVASGWVVGGWLIDDLREAADYASVHPPRQANHSNVLIGGSR